MVPEKYVYMTDIGQAGNIRKVSRLLAQTAGFTHHAGVITAAQIRAARALIGWTQADLAKESGVSEVAIKNIERGASDPRVSTMAAIQRAFDQAGVMFLEPGDIRDGGPGVRLKHGG